MYASIAPAIMLLRNGNATSRLSIATAIISPMKKYLLTPSFSISCTLVALFINVMPAIFIFQLCCLLSRWQLYRSPWSSGYDGSLTSSKSPVRIWAGSFEYYVFSCEEVP